MREKVWKSVNWNLKQTTGLIIPQKLCAIWLSDRNNTVQTNIWQTNKNLICWYLLSFSILILMSCFFVYFPYSFWVHQKPTVILVESWRKAPALVSAAGPSYLAGQTIQNEVPNSSASAWVMFYDFLCSLEMFWMIWWYGLYNMSMTWRDMIW